MAERRMFAKTIVLSDAFLDMPATARCLYFTLGMFADDDGFINSPKGIIRQCGASEDDLKILIAKKFIIPLILISIVAFCPIHAAETIGIRSECNGMEILVL